jgi:hypothetical protein
MAQYLQLLESALFHDLVRLDKRYWYIIRRRSPAYSTLALPRESHLYNREALQGSPKKARSAKM